MAQTHTMSGEWEQDWRSLAIQQMKDQWDGRDDFILPVDDRVVENMPAHIKERLGDSLAISGLRPLDLSNGWLEVE